MVIGNIRVPEAYGFLEKAVEESLFYAKSHDLAGLEPGAYKIDEERLFVNIVEYTTALQEKRFWEAHRKYADVHLILHGTEQIDLNFVCCMECREYVEEDDFLPMDGDKNVSAVLKEGDFLVCYPGDAHRTAVAVGKPEKIKKAIFKVRL